MMLSNREKELCALAYYQGVCDNQILDDRSEAVIIRKSVNIATNKILRELGLNIPDKTDFNAFLDEMDIISKLLLKEKDFEE